MVEVKHIKICNWILSKNTPETTKALITLLCQYHTNINTAHNIVPNLLMFYYSSVDY